jgi:hypothetical protein
MTIYTCIVGSYDQLKEPHYITPGWRYVCFTDQDLHSDTWQIRKIPLLPEGPRRTARRCKILYHHYIEDKYSIYVDGSFLVNCDLNEWWKQFVPPMTCIKHPIRNCIYQEARAVLRNERGGVEKLANQIVDYKAMKIPPHGGLIQSGILLRELQSDVMALCESWWRQVAKYSARDQIAFAAAAHFNYVCLHETIKWDYRKGREFIYCGHKKQ